MAKREVPIVGNYSLLFNMRNITAFFDAYQIKTLEEFEAFWEKDNTYKLGLPDFIKIVMYGLQRKDKEVSYDDAFDIVDEFMEEKSLLDLIELIIQAQIESLVSKTEGEAKGDQPKATKPPKQSKN